MSEAEDTRTFVQVKAPVTGWEFALRMWWLWLIIFGVVLYVLFGNYLPRSWQYGYWALIGVFAVVWWFLGQPEGWALDTTNMDDGEIGLVPLNKYQVERVGAKPGIMMFNSESGLIALVGHRLISLDDDGKPLIHPMIELKTNSEIARRVAKSQERIISDYLVMKSAVEVEVNLKFEEAYAAWREKARLDPELKQKNSE